MSNELIYRAFEPDLEIRSAAKGGDGRTIEGIAVPWGRPVEIRSPQFTGREQFANGAFNHQLRAAHRIFFGREHIGLGGAIIGKAIELRNDPAGLWGAFRVSATPAGDETLTLVEDGVLGELSVGFRERQNRRLKDGTVERTKADLKEVVVTMAGAYGELATVSAVRSEEEEQGRPRLDEAAQILASLKPLG